MAHGDVFTLGRWVVKDGAASGFIAAWTDLGNYFLSLPDPPGPGVLIQSAQDPRLLYSFGPWPSSEAVDAMRADPRTPEHIAKLTALCDEATPGTFHVVAEVD